MVGNICRYIYIGIIFEANNPLLKLFPRFPFCFDDPVVPVFVSDNAEPVSMLAEISDGMKCLAVGQQYLGTNASNPQIILFFNSLNCLTSTNFASGWQSGKDLHLHTVSSS